MDQLGNFFLSFTINGRISGARFFELYYFCHRRSCVTLIFEFFHSGIRLIRCFKTIMQIRGGINEFRYIRGEQSLSPLSLSQKRKKKRKQEQGGINKKRKKGKRITHRLTSNDWPRDRGANQGEARRENRPSAIKY